MRIEDIINKLHTTPKLQGRWLNWLDRLQLSGPNQFIVNHRTTITVELADWAGVDSRHMQNLLLNVLDIEQNSNDHVWLRNLNDIVIPYLQSYVEPLLCQPTENK